MNTVNGDHTQLINYLIILDYINVLKMLRDVDMTACLGNSFQQSTGGVKIFPFH